MPFYPIHRFERAGIWQGPKKGLEALAYQGKLAVQQDGAECILLGCAGFVDFVEDLSASWRSRVGWGNASS